MELCFINRCSFACKKAVTRLFIGHTHLFNLKSSFTSHLYKFRGFIAFQTLTVCSNYYYFFWNRLIMASTASVLLFHICQYNSLLLRTEDRQNSFISATCGQYDSVEACSEPYFHSSLFDLIRNFLEDPKCCDLTDLLTFVNVL